MAAAGDNGTSIGAAYYLYNSILKQPRNFVHLDPYLGTSYDNNAVKKVLDEAKVRYEYHEDIAAVTAKLLHVMSRLYSDAGNGDMEREMSARALKAFHDAYQNARLTPKQEQQVCVLIGELYLKQNDLKNSIVYFNKAKANGERTSVLHRHAESRIYDIRARAAAR